MSRRGWSLIALVAVLAVAAQVGAAALLWQHTRPRLPALTAVSPRLDRGIAAVVGAVGANAAVAVSDLVPITACERTPLARGSIFTRTADLYTDPGTEDALIARIGAALPAGEHPARGQRVGGGASPLDADLGGGASLQVIQIGAGWVAATAKTDCRASARAGAAPGTPVPASAAVTALLTGLHTGPAAWHLDSVACPAGRITTVDAISRTTDTGNLVTRLAQLVPPGARRFGTDSNRLAWRDGGTSVIVAAADDGTHITVQRTTGC